MNPGLYLHIPFCEQRCYYCAFTVAVAPEHTFEPYIDRLIREIEISGFDLDPATVYFGGGTPSLVNAEMIGRILKTLRSVPSEVSIEVNPGTLSKSKVERYRDLRISRISLGAQSLEDEDLERAGRLHKSTAVFTDFHILRREGFTNINLDLIAGLPGQQLETWTRNLDRVLELRPELVDRVLARTPNHVQPPSFFSRHTPSDTPKFGRNRWMPKDTGALWRTPLAGGRSEAALW